MSSASRYPLLFVSIYNRFVTIRRRLFLSKYLKTGILFTHNFFMLINFVLIMKYRVLIKK